MDDAALIRFIAHYEGITRTLLAADWADITVDIDPDRVPVALHAVTHRALDQTGSCRLSITAIGLF